MFKFLRDKLKEGISRFSKRVEEEGREEIKEVEKPETIPEEKKEAPLKPQEEKKGFFKSLKERFQKKKAGSVDLFDEALPENQTKPAELTAAAKAEAVAETPVEKPKGAKAAEKKSVKKEPVKEPALEKDATKESPDTGKEEKKGFFHRLTEKIVTKKIDGTQFEELFWNLEVVLLENNVAVEVIERIKEDLKAALVDTPLRRGGVEEAIEKELKHSVEKLFETPPINLLTTLRGKKPYVICFVGINGSGKTTTIAKMAHWLKSKGFSVVLAAADTFRAASIEQLQHHADALGIKLVKHNYGSDPAAVAFDAIKHAESKKTDVVLIDTAGRIHSNTSLLDEMKKIVRVAKPDMKIFVGESITGNDCTEQAKQFNEAIGIDAIVLAKADVDEKGGAAISVSYVTQKPILFIGTGQKYEDLEEFDPKIVVASLGLEA